MNNNFKKATIDNIDDIKYIIDKCGMDMYERFGLEHWRNGISIEYIKNSMVKNDVYIVINGENIIATFTINNNVNKFFLDIDNNMYLYISKVAVNPKYSGKGIGRDIIKFCETEAISRHLKGIRLDVYDKSNNAIRFYENCGFKIKFTEKTNHFKVLCMEKKFC